MKSKIKAAKKATKPIKNVAIVFHAKPAIREKLIKAAKKNELTLSGYLREVVVGKRPALN